MSAPHPYNLGGASVRGRPLDPPAGRQVDPPTATLAFTTTSTITTITPRRSRSFDGDRPQYRDTTRRKKLTSGGSSAHSSLAMPLHIGLGNHRIPLSEPGYHDVVEMRVKESRSLSPADRRRAKATTTATPYDPLISRMRQDDPYRQQDQNEAYKQRYSKTKSKLARNALTNSLIMFSDAFDSGSVLTGWSEQELIQKQKKGNQSKREKRDKSYGGKKKKGREPKILNMPMVLKRGQAEQPVAAAMEKKRYYRGDDGPNGIMTSQITRKRTFPSPRPLSGLQASSRRSWSLGMSRSSEMESTESSSETLEDVTNPAAKRWLQAKQRRSNLFPLLSTKSAEVANFQKDAPGPVARKPSPPVFDPTPKVESPKEPIEQLRITKDANHKDSPFDVFSGLSGDFVKGEPDLNLTPDFMTSHRYAAYAGTGYGYGDDVRDDGSPTSVAALHPNKLRMPRERSPQNTGKPKSILRNAPGESVVARGGTYPISRAKPLNDGDQTAPRKMVTRFSEHVEQRTYHSDEDVYFSDPEFEPKEFMNGAFPIQQSPIQPSPVQQTASVNEVYSVDHFADEKEEDIIWETSRGSTTRDLHQLDESPELNGESFEVPPPPEGVAFKDSNGRDLSPIRGPHESSVIVETVDSESLNESVSRHAPDVLSAFKPSYPSQSIVPPETLPGGQGTLRVTADSGGIWLKDDDLVIDDDEFECSQNEQNFIEVVAAVVIQTTFRRFLAVLTFERMMEDHFKAIGGSDLLERNWSPDDQQKQSQDSQMSQVEARRESETKANANTDSTPPVAHGSDLSEPDQRRQHPPTNQERVQIFISSAITIQRVFRGWWVRDSLHVDHFCATLIQKGARGFLARTNFYYDVFCVILIQSYVRMVIAREMTAERLSCIVTLQATARGYLARRRCKQIFSSEKRLVKKESEAAITIQACCRGYLQQLRYLNTLADVLIVQSAVRRWRVNTVVVPSLVFDQVPEIKVDNYSQGAREQDSCDGDVFLGTWRKKSKLSPERPPRQPFRTILRVENPYMVGRAINGSPSDEVSITSVNQEEVVCPTSPARIMHSINQDSEVINPSARHPSADAFHDKSKTILRPSSQASSVPSQLVTCGSDLLEAESNRVLESADISFLGMKSRKQGRAVVAAPDDSDYENTPTSSKPSKNGSPGDSHGRAMQVRAVASFPNYSGERLSAHRVGAGTSKETTRAKFVASEDSAVARSRSEDQSESKASLGVVPPRSFLKQRQAFLLERTPTVESVESQLSTASNPPNVRKRQKNSMAAFWEQKTMNQSKPMFPPAGSRL